MDTKLTISYNLALPTRKLTKFFKRNYKEYCQQDVILPPALVRHIWSAESSPGLPIQGTYGFTGVKPGDGPEDDEGNGPSVIQGAAS